MVTWQSWNYFQRKFSVHSQEGLWWQKHLYPEPKQPKPLLKFFVSFELTSNSTNSSCTKCPQDGVLIQHSSCLGGKGEGKLADLILVVGSVCMLTIPSVFSFHNWEYDWKGYQGAQGSHFSCRRRALRKSPSSCTWPTLWCNHLPIPWTAGCSQYNNRKEKEEELLDSGPHYFKCG